MDCESESEALCGAARVGRNNFFFNILELDSGEIEKLELDLNLMY